MRSSNNPDSEKYYVFKADYRRVFDSDGYDQKGYNKLGFDRDGNFADGGKYDYRGLDVNRFDKNGFGRKHVNGLFRVVHRDTMNKYNPEGYDRNGYDKDGYDKDGYDIQGRDKNNLNRRGFDKDKIHYITGTKYDPEGFDDDGYNERLFKRNVFGRLDYHKITQGMYDEHGFDGYEIHRETGTKYNEGGFDCYGIHKITGTKYDEEGYDIDGKDKNGFIKETALERSRQFAIILNNIKQLANGELSVEKYKFTSSLTMEELLDIAIKAKLSSEIRIKLKRLIVDYKRLSKKSNIKELCDTTSFIDSNNVVSLSKYYDFINDDLINYLTSNKIFVCDYTIKKYFRLYYHGMLDLNLSLDENIQANIEKEKKKERDKQVLQLMLKVKKVKENK